MCFFITIAIPEQHAETLHSDVRSGLRFDPTANPSVLSSLPPGYNTFLLTSHGCSCHLYLRELLPRVTSGDLDNLARKYARNGWSKRKIERAIEQSMSGQVRADDFVGFRDDVNDMLYQMAAKIRSIGLLVHCYNGRVDEERFEIGKPRKTEAAHLGNVMPEEDCWLWIGDCLPTGVQ